MPRAQELLSSSRSSLSPLKHRYLTFFNIKLNLPTLGEKINRQMISKMESILKSDFFGTEIVQEKGMAPTSLRKAIETYFFQQDVRTEI